MYRNLEAELKRCGLTKGDLAERMNIQATTLSNKFNGKSHFTLNEAFRIKSILNVTMTIEELFTA